MASSEGAIIEICCASSYLMKDRLSLQKKEQSDVEERPQLQRFLLVGRVLVIVKLKISLDNSLEQKAIES